MLTNYDKLKALHNNMGHLDLITVGKQLESLLPKFDRIIPNGRSECGNQFTYRIFIKGIPFNYFKGIGHKGEPPTELEVWYCLIFDCLCVLNAGGDGHELYDYIQFELGVEDLREKARLHRALNENFIRVERVLEKSGFSIAGDSEEVIEMFNEIYSYIEY